MPSPSWKLLIGGAEVPRDDVAGTGVVLKSLTPIARGGVPMLRFDVRNDPWPGLPDPHNGKTAELQADFQDGLGWISIFRGNAWKTSSTKPGALRFIRSYECTGMRDRADRVPAFDENTGSNTLTFNAPKNSSEYRANRAGRTLGQAIVEVLSQPTTIASLTSLGVGGYGGTGSGASAHCVMNGRSVNNIVVDLPGSGYSTATPVTILLFGGGGSGASVSSFTTSGGGIATISLASGGTNYKSPPTVILTKLPAITVSDLLKIDMVPTRPIQIGGERILGAIEGVLEDRNPHYWVDVEPDGTIRFHDQRKFGNTVATLTGGGPSRPAIVVPVVVKSKIEALWISDPGAGYVSTPTIAFTDPDGSGASYTLTRTAGQITGYTKVSAGTGYSGGRAKVVIDGVDSQTEVFSTGRDVRNCYPRLQILGGTYNKPTPLRLSDGTLIENFAHDGLDNNTSKLYWKEDDYVDPFEDGSTALAVTTLNSSGGVNAINKSNAGYGYNYASPPSITISPAPGSGCVLRTVINTTTNVISRVDVLAQGSGYDGPTPTLRVVGGGGTGGTFLVHTSGGKVTSVDVLTGGSGYTFPPTPILTGVGAGSGATGHVIIDGGIAGGNGSVSSIVVDNAGSGYTHPPIATVASHGGTASRSVGTCAVINSTTIRLTPSDGRASWVSNYWDQSSTGSQGLLAMSYIDGVGVRRNFAGRIATNPSLTAGGTCDVVLDSPVDSLSYTEYTLTGTGTPASKVWRSYLPANPALRPLLQEEFSIPVADNSSDQSSSILKTHAFGKIVYTPSGSTRPVESEWALDINRDTGEILFRKPVVDRYGSPANLATGGSSTDGIPTDILVWVPVRSSTLTSTYPADIAGVPQYEGDSYAREGLTFTKYIHVESWTDPSQQVEIDKIAKELHGTLKDAVVEGPFSIMATGRAFFHPGIAVDLYLEDGTTTGYESAKIPLVGASISFNANGAIEVQTTANISTRRAQFSGASAIPQPLSPPVPWPSGEAFGAPAGANYLGGAGQGQLAAFGKQAGGMESAFGNQMGAMESAFGGSQSAFNSAGKGAKRGFDSDEAAQLSGFGG